MPVLDRRRLVVAAIEKKSPAFPKFYQEKMAQLEGDTCKRLMENKAIPYLSARYVNWRVDFEIWTHWSRFMSLAHHPY